MLANYLGRHECAPRGSRGGQQGGDFVLMRLQPLDGDDGHGPDRFCHCDMRTVMGLAE